MTQAHSEASQAPAAAAQQALELADRCRLLALNAAIEASGAGEEGQDIAGLIAEMERMAAEVRSAVESFSEIAGRSGPSL